MTRGSPLKSWLVFWIVFTGIALLSPSPREWGAFGKWFSPHFDIIRPFAQPLAHFVLMAVIAAMLMRMLEAKPAWSRLGLTLLVTLSFAGLFEFAQSLLPPVFGRSGDVDDMVSSFVGATGGCLFSLLFRRNVKE